MGSKGGKAEHEHFVDGGILTQMQRETAEEQGKARAVINCALLFSPVAPTVTADVEHPTQSLELNSPMLIWLNDPSPRRSVSR